MNDTRSQLWIGVIQNTGALIVFDPVIQIEGQELINVYSVGRDLVRKFDPEGLRTMVTTVYGHQRDEALRKYMAWKHSTGKSFLEQELAFIEARKSKIAAEAEIRQRQLIARHKAFLEKEGMPYEGTYAGRAKPHRIAHCWACKQHLDNNIHIECAACAWIICSCGACGCGRATSSN